MKLSSVLLSTVMALTLPACKQKESSGGGAGSGAPPASGLEPFTGTLTVERVLSLADLPKPFDPWPAAQARLEKHLGKPTKINEIKHMWAATEGDDCAYVLVERVEQEQGVVVGAVVPPQKLDKKSPTASYRDCLQIAGKSPATAEDPNAPPPPTDGRVIPLAELRENAARGPSKWEGQSVRISATFSGASTSTAGTNKYVGAMLEADPDDIAEPVRCSLAPNIDVPKDLAVDGKVIAAGIVTLVEWTSTETGMATLVPGLANCTLQADTSIN